MLALHVTCDKLRVCTNQKIQKPLQNLMLYTSSSYFFYVYLARKDGGLAGTAGHRK